MRPAPLALFLVALVACERPPSAGEQARRQAARILRGTLAYPQSTVVSLAAGDDAAEATLSTPSSPEAVADWYRQVLRVNGWELKQDAPGAGGDVTIYAERAGRPLWITVRRAADGPGTLYTLIGAAIEGDSIR